MLAPIRLIATVATSINKHTANELTIQPTRAGLGRCHFAFAVANCLLNRRFATATVGSRGVCWKLRRVASKAHNMTENALSILIVIFSIQLQQTEISDRKLFIFQHCSVAKVIPHTSLGWQEIPCKLGRSTP